MSIFCDKFLIFCRRVIPCISEGTQTFSVQPRNEAPLGMIGMYCLLSRGEQRTLWYAV